MSQPNQDVGEISKNLAWIKSFVQYARYELQPGTPGHGSQFPGQDDADKAIKLLDEIAKALQNLKPAKDVEEVMREFDKEFPVKPKAALGLRTSYPRHDIIVFIRRHCQPPGLRELDRKKAKSLMKELYKGQWNQDIEFAIDFVCNRFGTKEIRLPEKKKHIQILNKEGVGHRTVQDWRKEGYNQAIDDCQAAIERGKE